MALAQQRLARLESRLTGGGDCPACHGVFVMVVVSVDEDGRETIAGDRCPLCGSPDSIEIEVGCVPSADVLDGR